METCKKQKNRYLLFLFLFINDIDLKNYNRSYRKSFWIFWMLEKLQWPCFKSILIIHEITYDAVMKSSGVGGGGPRMQGHTQMFWFAENLGNIPDNPRKNGAQRCLQWRTQKIFMVGVSFSVTWWSFVFGVRCLWRHIVFKRSFLT